MNSHLINTNGISKNMLLNKKNEIIDLTSDWEVNEHEIQKSKIKPSLLLPKLNEIFMDSNSLYLKEGCLEKMDYSLSNLPAILDKY